MRISPAVIDRRYDGEASRDRYRSRIPRITFAI